MHEIYMDLCNCICVHVNVHVSCFEVHLYSKIHQCEGSANEESIANVFTGTSMKLTVGSNISSLMGMHVSLQI